MAAHTEPPWLEKGPSTLSSVATSWLARGVTAGWSSFLPILGQLRPRNDISKSLSGGPTAWEARLENLALTGCAAIDGFSAARPGRKWPLVAPTSPPPAGP